MDGSGTTETSGEPVSTTAASAADSHAALGPHWKENPSVAAGKDTVLRITLDGLYKKIEPFLLNPEKRLAPVMSSSASTCTPAGNDHTARWAATSDVNSWTKTRNFPARWSRWKRSPDRLGHPCHRHPDGSQSDRWRHCPRLSAPTNRPSSVSRVLSDKTSVICRSA